MDASAIYFVTSEICMSITCIILVLLNTKLVESSNFWTGIANFNFLSAEVSVSLGLLSLVKRIEKKWFFIGILLTATVAIFLELIRPHIQPQTSVLLFSICSLLLFIVNYLICRIRLAPALRNNQFLNWFIWFELGMAAYGMVRVLTYFAPVPIVPRDDPNNFAVMLFSFFVVMGAFRYISYIGLRITLVDPVNLAQNQLNQALLRVIEEKDRLLGGLIASNRMIGLSALASSLSHQLSQPLTTIALRADTTRRTLIKAGQDSNVIGALDEIANQSSKLADLVKNLRRLFGSKGVTYAPIPLQKTIDEIIEIVSPSLESKKITLHKDYRDNPIVHGDGIQIQQVLINVLNNAIEAITSSPRDPKIISIRLSCNAQVATIAIQDSGPGIAPGALPAIFDLYKTTKQEGLGVGLWLSKTIMESHHGSISASNSSDGGAVFTIELPMQPSAPV